MRFFKKSDDQENEKKSPGSGANEDFNENWDSLEDEHREQELSRPREDETESGLDAANFLAGATSSFREPEFRTSVSNETDRIDVTSEIPSPTSFSREKGADLNAMRLDVARISADIQSGEELYRRAQKRIDNLTSFVERAEVDFSLLNRLEPENRRLKARVRTLESEFDDKIRRIRLLEAEIEDQKSRILERNKTLDETQNKLALAKTSLRDYERNLKTAQDSADRGALAAERAETALDVEKRENEVLRQKLVETTVAVEEKQSGYIEAKKIADSLTQDCEDFRNRAEVATAEVIELRNALDDAKKQNSHMKSEMVQLHEDIRSFKTEYEFNMVAREDEIIALQTQINTLQKQLDVKDEIVRNAARDVTELRKIRTAQDLERERLESMIETQNFQLEESRSELLKTQQDVSDFDRRYRDVTAALTASQARRTSNPPSESPDIQPTKPPMPEEQDVLASEELKKAGDELGNLTEDDIDGHVTDFKLGQRKDIF